MDEQAALATLAPGADPVAVGIIAADICSPWQSERRGVRGHPTDRTAVSEHHFLALIEALSGDLRPQTPEGTGLAAWVQFYGLAIGWPDVQGPNWTADESLRPHYLALPPRGWPTPISEQLFTLDARAISLHVLASRNGLEEEPPSRILPSRASRNDGEESTRKNDGEESSSVRLEAVRVLCEWIVYSSWSTSSGDQCQAMRTDWKQPGPWQWWNRSQQPSDVDQLVTLVTGPLSVPPDWTRPEPSPAEQAAEMERQRTIARGRMNAAKWGRSIRTDGTRVGG